MSRSLSTRRRVFAVLGGGFLGTLTRYGLSTLAQSWLGKGWPYDLLLINVTGALLLAFVTALADATLFIGPTRRLFINVGFLGAYTTFSSFALGDVLLLHGTQWMPALLYLVLSMAGGVLAVMLGDWLGQWCIRRTRRPTPGVKATRYLTGVLPGRHPDGTIDLQDELLLLEGQDEREMGKR